MKLVPSISDPSALVLLALIPMAGCGGGQSPAESDPGADVIYANARVYTVDEHDSWAEAIAIEDGRVVAVGSADDVMAHAGSDTTTIDLGGRMLMPGIHDTHIHPTDAGTQQTLECSFRSLELDEVLEILRECIAATPDGEWVRGGQWNEALFASGRMPKEILDDIAPNHPVFLMDWSVHNAWVNSLALEKFGIDADTPDPDGGVIVRDVETGEATGILLDNAAYDKRRELPRYDDEQVTAALAWGLEQTAQYGITTIKEAIVTTSNARAYRILAGRGELPLRVKTSLSWKSAWAYSHDDETALIDERADYASEFVDTGFAKIMLDGIPPTYTAAMLDPYEPSEAFGDDWRGKLMFAPDELADDVVELDARGISVKIHATGDRSARVALDAFEAARAANDDDSVVHEVSHAELIHPDDVPRFAALNVAAEMCPILWYPIPGLDWESWIGPDRKVWPVRTLVEAGALVTYGSDWPVVPTPNPWPGIEAMVTRADPAGGSDASLWAEQAVDLATAIRIFTINSAVANGVGERSGSLEAGKDADFIVLDRNIFDVPIGDVGDTRVVHSVVGGRVVVDAL